MKKIFVPTEIIDSIVSIDAQKGMLSIAPIPKTIEDQMDTLTETELLNEFTRLKNMDFKPPRDFILWIAVNYTIGKRGLIGPEWSFERYISK